MGLLMDVRTLIMVTCITSIRQVVEMCGATMFRGDDMVRLVGDECNIIGQSTIFATVCCSHGYR